VNRFFALALLASVSMFANVPSASAHSHHTANYCSTTLPDVCAHLGFENEPNSTDEAQFMLDLAPSKANLSKITKVAVALEMNMNGMTHGSSPVTLTPVDAAHYEVTKAYFVMSGAWHVKVTFELNGAAGELSIPIDVK
jgi:hypothetical protein